MQDRDSQERATAIGTAVEEANETIAALGLAKNCVIVYTAGCARLLDYRGREVDVECDWDCPEIAVPLVLYRFLDRLRALSKGRT